MVGSWIISLLQTDAVITLIVGAFVTYLVKWLASTQGKNFKKYEGYAITAVKAAEKAIPDGTDNRGARKLDFALKMFLQKYEAATGVVPDVALMAQIEDWLAVIHNVIDEAGMLKSPANTGVQS